MTLDLEQERSFRLLEQIYRPFANIRELESGNNQVPLFDALQNGEIVIGSGSPRNPRFVRAIKTSPVSQLPLKYALRKLKDIGSPIPVLVNVLETYREPRRQWDLHGDNGLSMGKARLALASVLALCIAKKLQLPDNFSVIGRDFTPANYQGEFLERPGFTFRYRIEGIEMPESWIIEGEEPTPDMPAEQLSKLSLFDKPQPFYTANATTLLHYNNPQNLTLDDIVQLYDLNSSLPGFVKSSTSCTFMALKPDMAILDGSEGIAPTTLFDYYTKSRHPYGDLLYAIPGVIDWSRSPFRDHLQIFKSKSNSEISLDLPKIMHEVNSGNGEWHSYTAISQPNQDISNELVGVSTLGTRIALL